MPSAMRRVMVGTHLPWKLTHRDGILLLAGLAPLSAPFNGKRATADLVLQ